MEQEAPAGWEFFDSVDFPTDHIDDPMGRPRVRHVVTAVVVGHEGAAWLPRLSEALWALNPRPDRLIAVDTGSTDETAELLAAMPGVEPVVSVSARTGFGVAVARGLEAVGFAPIPSAVGPYGDDGHMPVVEWLWLLHDDCAPAPKALEQLLLQATITPGVGVWGPKLRLWPRDRELLEVGVTTSLGGRRDTGIETGELDQGQHDQPRNVLAVSSAGMLVRRDVWEALHGFDPRLPMFRDDIDFGWRASRAASRSASHPTRSSTTHRPPRPASVRWPHPTARLPTRPCTRLLHRPGQRARQATTVTDPALPLRDDPSLDLVRHRQDAVRCGR